MRLVKNVLHLLTLLCLITTLMISCGGETESQTTTTTTAKKKKKKEKPSRNKDFTSSENDDREVVKLEISGDDGMRYDKKELRVKAGTRVELTLKHSGKVGASVMGHNVVILQPDVDMSEFCQEAMMARKNEYIPEGVEGVIAHTAMIGGGQTSTVLFDAPEKGTYNFLCTFPGHFTFMNGKFIVE
ncbi:MAG: azurin [Bacteroidota bacterium]